MTPLRLHSEPVQEAWLDAYGHLNEAYYLVPFSNATWKLQDHFGIGVDYFEATGGAIYTVETHLRYLREVRAPALCEISSLVIGADAKRFHFAHIMTVDGTERATVECMTLHFDSKVGKTAPFPEEIQAALQAAAMEDPPEWIGRSLALPEK